MTDQKDDFQVPVEVIAAIDVAATFPITLQGMSSHRNDRDVSASLFLSLADLDFSFSGDPVRRCRRPRLAIER